MTGVAIFAGAILLLQGCQSAELQYAAGTEGKSANELAWIVTPLTTKVLRIDGQPVSGNYKPLPADNIQNWIAVVPGTHELTLFYDDLSYSSAAASTLAVRTVAGHASYVYGRASAEIRYYSLLLNRPAGEDLISHVHRRIGEGKLPCALLPCDD